MALGSAAGCVRNDGGDDGGVGAMLGESCETHDDCASGACIEIDLGRTVCTETCTDVLGSEECPPGWRCRGPEDFDGLACTCEPTSAVEVCLDGEDNDCDGKVDDCMQCGGTVVPPNSASHCGECGVRCVPGASCEDGQCVCGADDPEDCVADGTAESCDANADCDDGIECTRDSCHSGRCVFSIDPRECRSGSSCHVLAGGCVLGAECESNSDCADNDPCTTRERCDNGTGRCTFEPLDQDEDGHLPPECGGADCSDQNPDVRPDADEACDGVDNDCDDAIDAPLADDACGDEGECVLGACGCPSGLEDCSSVDLGFVCADVSNDSLNCGACRRQCPEGFGCESSSCRDIDECADGFECPLHSTCGNLPGSFECRCDQGFTPNADATQCIDFDECALGLDDCIGPCINTSGSFRCECLPGYTGDGRTCSDVDECEVEDCSGHGTCNNLPGTFSCTCDFGYAWNGATLECDLVNECQAGVLEDHAWCSSACHDVTTSNVHCGGCNQSCGSGGFCDGGDCACTDDALTYCISSCVNLQSSTQHCGACGDPCPSGAGCVAGDCVCPNGTEECGSSCVTLGSTSHCLGCDDRCPTGATCQPGGCTCPAGTPTECGNACVNTNTSAAHCGGCNMPCPTGATCGGGDCTCPLASPDVCEDACVNFAASEDHCGECGTSCDVVCIAGECATTLELALGWGFGCARFDDGRVGCFGVNDFGQLGRGLPSTAASYPLAFLNLTDIVKVTVQRNHGCVVRSNGQLHCWGDNSALQIPNAEAVDQPSPVQVRTGVADVAVGETHTCVVLSADGSIECAGGNSFGQHGDGTIVGTAFSGPSSLSDVDKLVSGSNHVCALKDGNVYCWGLNLDGQCGIGTSTQAVTAPTLVDGLSGVDDISAGDAHTCAVRDGSVYCWGRNTSYELGIGPSTVDQLFPSNVAGITDAVSVAAGYYHTCIVLQTDVVQCWGSATYQQNGGASTGATRNALPGAFQLVAAGSDHSCGLDDGDIYCWGSAASSSLPNPAITQTPRRIPR